MSKLDDLISAHEKMKLEYKKQAQDLFKEMAKEFWDKNPGLTAVKWTQYTPYFNDGDPCVFGVNDVIFTNAEDHENVSPWGDYEGEDEDVFATWSIADLLKESTYAISEKERKAALKIIDKIDEQACNEFSLAVSQLDDVMKDMFGDHVQVTLTRDGFDIEDYDHD